jgi:hypothetical protein
VALRSESTKRNLGTAATLTVGQRGALARLKRRGVLDGLYLAGGVAVAHHLGHRRSNDLDLFSSKPHLDLERLRRNATESLDAEVIAQSDATLKLRVGSAMIDIVSYPYRTLVRPLPGPEGVLVAGVRDLAVMKLAAIAKRGVHRDYWDLYEILKRTRLTLHRVCEDYLRKFGVSEADLYHVLRALNWFEDAEANVLLPRGLTRAKWREIRAWFEQQVPRELLGRTK